MSTDSLTPVPGLDGVDVVTSADADWDAARRAWNLTVDQRPDAVAMPATAAEVAQAARAARAAGLRVAVQATGHGAAARGGDLDRTLLINTARMRGVTVDPVARTARVEAGAQWMDVVPLAAEHGLVALHGSAPDVGVVGYTLGGGIGWIGRSHGLAANAVTAVELVTADGAVVRADAGTEPDLFWAIRGGGGGFGVVTALEFRLFPLETVHAGWLVWPWEEAGRVLRRWAEWLETVPDEVASIGRLLQVPPLPDVPEMVRGRALVVIEAAIIGDEAEGARLLEPLRELAPEIDTFAQIPAAGLGALHMDPPEPVPGIGDGSLFDELPAEAVDALVAVAGPGSGSPLLSVEVRHAGGAMERVPDDAGSLGHLDGRFVLYAVGLPMTPEMGAAVAERVQRVNAVMAEWGDGRRPMNFADAPADTGTMFDPEVFRRLREIRARVDPDGLLRPNHAIPRAD